MKKYFSKWRFRKNTSTRIEYFSNASDCLSYLEKTTNEIFISISDMHMPGMSGLAFKKIIDINKELSEKIIPFIFFSSHVNKQEIKEVYEYRVQGYFKKTLTVDEQAKQIDIIRYWVTSKRPGSDGE